MRIRTRLATLGALALLVAALLAGCGGAPPSNEVDMGVATFETAAVTIKAGHAVHFVDPVTGGVHIICVGEGVKCTGQPGAPAALSTPDGLTFNQGETKDIVFPTAGTYTVVCIIHPGMQTVVTVTP